MIRYLSGWDSDACMYGVWRMYILKYGTCQGASSPAFFIFFARRLEWMKISYRASRISVHFCL